MDILSLDSRKALAIEAFENGEYAEADRGLQSLEGVYSQLGHDDGLLAIGFNRFLIALEDGNRARTTELMGWLVESMEIHQDSPITYEIADRLFRLFSEPCPGVDHEATAALVAAASELVGRECIEPSRRLDVSSIPSLDSFAQYPAPEAAVRLMALVDELNGRTDIPNWARHYGELCGSRLGPSDDVWALIRAGGEALNSGDWAHAYRYLIDAQLIACQEHLPTACELGCILTLLERRGLPKKLAFSPNPPQEERDALAAEMYLVLGKTALETGNARSLGRLFTDAAVESCIRTIQWIEMRHERGAHRSADAERLARLATIQASVERMRNNLAEAQAVLAASLGKAERGAFGNPMVTIGVLEEAALIFERLGDRVSAQRCFESTLLGAIPGFYESQDCAMRADAVSAVAADSERVLSGVRALAGLARTRRDGGSRLHLERAREVIALSAEFIRGPVLGQAQLCVALTGARLGESGCALVALEAARVLGDRPATALALYYWAQETAQAETCTDFRASVTLLSNAVSTLKKLDFGPFRLALDLAIGGLFLKWLQSDDGPRVEAHFRRIAEGMEGIWNADIDWKYGVFLEGRWESHLNAFLSQLASSGTFRLVCPFLRAHRRGQAGKNGIYRAADSLSDEVTEFLWAKWLRPDDHRHEPLALPRNEISASLSLRSKPARRHHDCLVELCEIDGVLWVGANNGEVERSLNGAMTRQELDDALIRLSVGGGDGGQEFFDVAAALYNRLLGPLDDVIGVSRRVLLGLPSWALGLAPVLTMMRAKVGVAVVIDDTSEKERKPSDAIRLAICGDGTTGRDLQLSVLESPNLYDGVSVHYGQDLPLNGFADVFGGVQFVHLVGEVDEKARIDLLEGQDFVPLAHLAEGMSMSDIALVSLMGPVDAALVHRVGSLLLNSVGAALIRITERDAERRIATAFFREASRMNDSRDAVDAWSRTVRGLTEEGIPFEDISAYVLVVPET